MELIFLVTIMRKMVRFNIRQLLRTPFVVFCAVCILLGFIAFQILLTVMNTSFINYLAAFDSFAFFELPFILVLFCAVVYAARLPDEVERACLFSKAQARLARLLAILVVSLLLCVIPFAYVCVNAVLAHTGFVFTVSAAIYAVLRWVMLIGATEMLAFFFVLVVPTKAAYLFCIPTMLLLSVLNVDLLRAVYHGSEETLKRLSEFFSMHRPFVMGEIVDYAGARIDGFFLTKVVCVLVGIAVVVCLTWAVSARKKKLPVFALAATLLLECGCVWLWSARYPTVYDYREKLYAVDAAPQAATVSAYTGALRFGERTTVQCAVTVDPAQQKSVRFRLDACFALDEMRCGDEQLSYTREGDSLTVELPADVSAPVELSFRYHGRIYYISDIGTVSLYATRQSAALPARFALLPVIDGDQSAKAYDLTVDAGNTLVSNLEVEPLSRTRFRVSGTAATCSLFSGYLTQFERDGIVFYCAKYNRTDYEHRYLTVREYNGIDAFSGERLEECPEAEKVFMIYGCYGVSNQPIVYDGYWLVNYGFSSN